MVRHLTPRFGCLVSRKIKVTGKNPKEASQNGRLNSREKWPIKKGWMRLCCIRQKRLHNAGKGMTVFESLQCYRKELVCSWSQQWTAWEVPSSNYRNVDSSKTLGNAMSFLSLAISNFGWPTSEITQVYHIWWTVGDFIVIGYVTYSCYDAINCEIKKSN